MNNDPKTIKEEWGVDPLEGETLNEIQQTIVNESLGLEQSGKDQLKISGGLPIVEEKAFKVDGKIIYIIVCKNK